MNRSTKVLIFLIIFTTIGGGYLALKNLNFQGIPEEPTTDQRIPSEPIDPIQKQISTEIVAENTTIPWEIVFLPNNKLLITERTGNILIIDQQTTEQIELTGIEHLGEGGLLGAAISPEFDNNNYIYLYYTTETEAGLENRVVRYELNENNLTQDQIILEGVPAAAYHDGGRIKFGPDGYLYITTGDAGNPDLSQNTNSLAGKILRILPDGSLPTDNPFDNEIYSYGHRNPQGLTWDNLNRLWATEHGPSGASSGWDELNLILPGANYGWPEIIGDETQEGMQNPIIHSGGDETWAPAGAAFFNGNVYFAGLRGETLYKYNIENNILTRYLTGKYGRLRAVVLGPDNYLYISTSNKDGRGNPIESDDRIIRINPEQLE
jgi:glucose/arabinose dehydrogenase